MSETTSRVLQLLGLLQSRRVWTGEELAERLAVTTRSVRRDVERLRDLGYPVHASKGHGGGYQLGPDAALPPLLLDPDEAVAMAVCLRLAAGGSVAGVGESALRALSKLDQVMPARLRSQVVAVHDATVTLPSNYSDSPVEPDVLMTLARACRDHEHVTTGYVDRAGSGTQRRLEPYQLVTTGGRWFCWPTPPGRTGAACDWTGWPTFARSAARSSPAMRRTRRPMCDGRSAARRIAMWHAFATTRQNTFWRSTFHQPR